MRQDGRVAGVRECYGKDGAAAVVDVVADEVDATGGAGDGEGRVLRTLGEQAQELLGGMGGAGHGVARSRAVPDRTVPGGREGGQAEKIEKSANTA